MTIIKNRNLDTVGLVKDSPALSTPLQAFQDANNVRFENGSVEKIKGHKEIFSGLVGGPTKPTFTAYWPNINKPLWIIADQSDIYTVDVDKNVTKINKSGTTYSTSAQGWEAIIFNNRTLILNNGVDTPQYVLDYTGNTTALELADLPGWASYTIPANRSDTGSEVTTGNYTVSAGIIRAFGNILVAGNLVERLTDSTIVRELTTTIRTSALAAPGQIPQNWNPFSTAATTEDEFELGGSSDVKDMRELNNNLLVYTSKGIHGLRLTGRPDLPVVVSQITKAYGAFNNKSVIEFDGNHFVVGNDDIWAWNGNPTSIKSISEGRVRSTFYEELHPVTSNNLTVLRNSDREEIWLTYPTITSADGSINKALIWNYRNNRWTQRDLPNIISGDLGSIEGGGIAGATVTLTGTGDPAQIQKEKLTFTDEDITPTPQTRTNNVDAKVEYNLDSDFNSSKNRFESQEVTISGDFNTISSGSDSKGKFAFDTNWTINDTTFGRYSTFSDNTNGPKIANQQAIVYKDNMYTAIVEVEAPTTGNAGIYDIRRASTIEALGNSNNTITLPNSVKLNIQTGGPTSLVISGNPGSGANKITVNQNLNNPSYLSFYYNDEIYSFYDATDNGDGTYTYKTIYSFQENGYFNFPVTDTEINATFPISETPITIIPIQLIDDVLATSRFQLPSKLSQLTISDNGTYGIALKGRGFNADDFSQVTYIFTSNFSDYTIFKDKDDFGGANRFPNIQSIGNTFSTGKAYITSTSIGVVGTWSDTSESADTIYSLIKFNNLIILNNTTDNHTQSSSDGITFTNRQITNLVNVDLIKINNIIIGPSSPGFTAVRYSTDGITWNGYASGFGDNDGTYGIYYFNNKYYVTVINSSGVITETQSNSDITNSSGWTNESLNTDISQVRSAITLNNTTTYYGTDGQLQQGGQALTNPSISGDLDANNELTSLNTSYNHTFSDSATTATLAATEFYTYLSGLNTSRSWGFTILNTPAGTVEVDYNNLNNKIFDITKIVSSGEETTNIDVTLTELAGVTPTDTYSNVTATLDSTLTAETTAANADRTQAMTNLSSGITSHTEVPLNYNATSSGSTLTATASMLGTGSTFVFTVNHSGGDGDATFGSVTRVESITAKTFSGLFTPSQTNFTDTDTVSFTDEAFTDNSNRATAYTTIANKWKAERSAITTNVANDILTVTFDCEDTAINSATINNGTTADQTTSIVYTNGNFGTVTGTANILNIYDKDNNIDHTNTFRSYTPSVPQITNATEANVLTNLTTYLDTLTNPTITQTTDHKVQEYTFTPGTGADDVGLVTITRGDSATSTFNLPSNVNTTELISYYIGLHTENISHSTYSGNVITVTFTEDAGDATIALTTPTRATGQTLVAGTVVSTDAHHLAIDYTTNKDIANAFKIEFEGVNKIATIIQSGKAIGDSIELLIGDDTYTIDLSSLTQTQGATAVYNQIISDGRFSATINSNIVTVAAKNLAVGAPTFNLNHAGSNGITVVLTNLTSITDQERPWTTNSINTNRSFLVMIKPDKKLYAMDLGYTFDGDNYNSFVQRDLASIDSVDQSGALGGLTIKDLNIVYPIFDAETGTIVTIDINTSNKPIQMTDFSSANIYSGDFEIGVDYKLNSRTTGRYISYKITMIEPTSTKLVGMDLDMDVEGVR